ncbi:DUF421 domain-containing protein [Exiguobacterium sp. SH1S4]|nr:DUF421 domain-containing protein [Exiguobacterium sp. SH4S7]TCI48709.1 DUF421 domain-containing protein [Exiguobacterium sp. SH5S32]TCI55588.1 DUF421 domain-containing protein [Exiguobacterium sp. SH1S4]TCI63571.1 DUF421 domain-containing protein [Exiguobacterium sp. SH0S2]TCI75386.1 DUF421 domain-containing protein [Exiguobacterium sp. SH1S1]TCI78121.1 DUF421 domain-containing protein [Exiguobacterium sp. SH0S1]
MIVQKQKRGETMDQLKTMVQIILTGIGAYFSIIFILRVSGKRTLSKMNAFDFIVTVALGSILATTLTSRQTPLLNGLVAFATLVALQYVMAKLANRSKRVNELIKSTPTMLYYRGSYLEAEMRKERVLEIEVLQAIRSSGTAHDKVEAVVLETDGTFSVLTSTEAVLQNVRK